MNTTSDSALSFKGIRLKNIGNEYDKLLEYNNRIVQNKNNAEQRLKKQNKKSKYVPSSLKENIVLLSRKVVRTTESHRKPLLKRDRASSLLRGTFHS